MTSSDLDVLIIGAGISGINAAYRLQTEFPQYRYALLEARPSLGGTWDLFRYPGIRSDSDLYTFGFQWFPWNQPNPIAEGGDILRYLDDAATTHHIKPHIRFQHRVQSAHWDGHRWTLAVEHPESTSDELRARFVIFATGYYDYQQPLDAAIPGLANFRGEVIHPQFWPASFDAHDKRIVVIGSGATAVTLVPSLAEDAASVTMLQRSPTFFASVPNARTSGVWTRLLPAALRYRVRRLWHLVVPQLFYQFCQRFPTAARAMLQKGVQRLLPPSVAVTPHFQPLYQPWDQRLCACPDGDFFRALRSTKARVETGHIAAVDGDGITLQSGRRLDADVLVTATGLKVQMFAGIPLFVHGQPVDISQKYTWNGLMLQDLPNATLVLGFVNASWTLAADIAMRLTCRLLQHMQAQGYSTAVPVVPSGRSLRHESVLDLKSTYIQRAVQDLPRASTQRPWVARTGYFSDLYFSHRGDVTEGLVFS